mgnify:CR=1 FL=1
MALLLTYFCSTSSRKKTVSFLSCLMPRVYPAHKPLQANISARKMALGGNETQEGTCACTCCWRTTRTSTRRGYHRPPARGSREVGPPRSTARIKRRSTHRRDGLAEISSKIAGNQRRECSLSSNQTSSEALNKNPTTSVEVTSASPDGPPARFRMVLSTGTGGACGLRS